MQDLTITLIQTNILWENIQGNLDRYETEYLNKLTLGETDLILFPELFTTGFTMNSSKYAEDMNGSTIKWMQYWSKRLDTQIGGSLIIKENNQYYNRFVIVSAQGVESYYDKNHLFRMGDENNHFSKGNKRTIHTIKGWRILLQVCYDLRFPVFSRNQTINSKKEYDALIYVANWPAIRSEIWNTLLKARAIENQTYCLGINRIGTDIHDTPHSGNSAIISPWGEVQNLKPNREIMFKKTLKLSVLKEITEKFPAHLDTNNFTITDN